MENQGISRSLTILFCIGLIHSNQFQDNETFHYCDNLVLLSHSQSFFCLSLVLSNCFLTQTLCNKYLKNGQKITFLGKWIIYSSLSTVLPKRNYPIVPKSVFFIFIVTQILFLFCAKNQHKSNNQVSIFKRMNNKKCVRWQFDS